MKRNTRMLLWGAAAVGAFWLWRKRQSAIMPGAAAAAGSPTTTVSPTAAPTTANMQALAGYINPTHESALHGGYGRVPVAYPGVSSPTIRRITG